MFHCGRFPSQCTFILTFSDSCRLFVLVINLFATSPAWTTDSFIYCHILYISHVDHHLTCHQCYITSVVSGVVCFVITFPRPGRRKWVAAAPPVSNYVRVGRLVELTADIVGRDEFCPA